MNDDSLYKVQQEVPIRNQSGKLVKWSWIAFSTSHGVDLREAELLGAYLQRVGLGGKIIRCSDGQVLKEWPRSKDYGGKVSA